MSARSCIVVPVVAAAILLLVGSVAAATVPAAPEASGHAAAKKKAKKCKKGYVKKKKRHGRGYKCVRRTKPTPPATQPTPPSTQPTPPATQPTPPATQPTPPSTQPPPQSSPPSKSAELIDAARAYADKVGRDQVAATQFASGVLDIRILGYSVEECELRSDTQARCTLYLLQQRQDHAFWNYYLWGYELALYQEFVFANRRDYGIDLRTVREVFDPYRIVCTDFVDRRSEGIPICSA